MMKSPLSRHRLSIKQKRIPPMLFISRYRLVSIMLLALVLVLLRLYHLPAEHNPLLIRSGLTVVALRHLVHLDLRALRLPALRAEVHLGLLALRLPAHQAEVHPVLRLPVLPVHPALWVRPVVVPVPVPVPVDSLPPMPRLIRPFTRR